MALDLPLPQLCLLRFFCCCTLVFLFFSLNCHLADHWQLHTHQFPVVGHILAVRQLDVMYDRGLAIVNHLEWLRGLPFLQSAQDVLWLFFDYGVACTVYDVLLLYPEEIPHAAAKDLDQAGQKWKESRFWNKTDYWWWDCKGPRAPEDEVEEDGYIVNERIFVAEMISQEAMLRTLLQKAPIIFLNDMKSTKSQ